MKKIQKLHIEKKQLGNRTAKDIIFLKNVVLPKVFPVWKIQTKNGDSKNV